MRHDDTTAHTPGGPGFASSPFTEELKERIQSMIERALLAESLHDLGEVMSDELHPHLCHWQMLVLADRSGGFDLIAHSGLFDADSNPLYGSWLRRVTRWLGPRLPYAQPTWMQHELLALPPEIAEGWVAWWPRGAWCIPLHDADGRRLAVVLSLLDEPPTHYLVARLEKLWCVWSRCWAYLAPTNAPHRRGPGWPAALMSLAAAWLI